MSSNHALEAQFKIGEFEFVAARGNNPTEFEQALGAIPAVLGLIREVQAELGHPVPTEASVAAQFGAVPVAPAAAGWGAPAAAVAPVYQLPQQSGPPPSGVPTQTCAHGAMTRRQGNSARGPWTGYFCRLPKGDPNQCKAVFAD